MGRYVVQLVRRVAGSTKVHLGFISVLLCLGESLGLSICMIKVSRGRARNKNMELY